MCFTAVLLVTTQLFRTFLYLQTRRPNSVNSSVNRQSDSVKDKVVGESRHRRCSIFCECHHCFFETIFFLSSPQFKKTRQDIRKTPKPFELQGTGSQMDRETPGITEIKDDKNKPEMPKSLR